MAEYLTCPMCGFGFEKDDTLCAHGCPLGALCNLIRCPSCAYEFPQTPRAVSWLRRLFKRTRAPAPIAERVHSVRDLKGGARGRVVCLGGGPESRHRQLAVFGVTPGAELTVLQQHPSTVVQIGETELALDAAIAGEILVETIEEEAA